MKMRIATLLAVGIMAVAGLQTQAFGESIRGRLFYKIVETAPGSHSQGWHGILYNRGGKVRAIKPGEVVDTSPSTGTLLSGRFVGVACSSQLWKPCGAIPEVMLKSGTAPNEILPEKWSYKMYVSAEETKNVGTHGELWRNNKIVKPQSKNAEVQTAMGVFFWIDNLGQFDSHGWYPKKS